jgi:hypothetical protein
MTFYLIWNIIASFAAGYFFISAYRNKRDRRAMEIQRNMTHLEFQRLHAERHNMCRLSAIRREGRSNKFQFVRNGEIFEIETMGLLGDDIQTWKMKAGISDLPRIEGKM